MIRSDDPFKRIQPTGYTPSAASTGKPAEPSPQPVTQQPAAEPSAGPTDTRNVREIGGTEQQPFDPEQGLTFPGARPSSAQTPRIALVNSLLDTEEVDLNAPDFLNLGADAEDAVFYWQAACDASRCGDHKMASDLLTWAREFDPGAPDLPKDQSVA